MHRISDMSLELREQYDAGKHKFDAFQKKQDKQKMLQLQARVDALKANLEAKLDRHGKYIWSARELAEFYASAKARRA